MTTSQRPPRSGRASARRSLPCLSEWWVVGLQDEIADTCLRRVDRGLTVADVGPGTECNAEVHCAGEAWSGVLWAIRGALGALVADRLVVQANYGLAAESGYQDASRLLLAADRALNGGAHQAFLGDLLRTRGFLDPERLDDTPPDATPIGVPARVEGRVDWLDDPHDVLALPLLRGRGVSIRVTATGGDLDLRLYRPGTLTLSDAGRHRRRRDDPRRRESFAHIPAADGTYYLDVAASSGASTYVVETIADADGDGRPDGSDNCATSPNPGQQTATPTERATRATASRSTRPTTPTATGAGPTRTTARARRTPPRPTGTATGAATRATAPPSPASTA